MMMMVDDMGLCSDFDMISAPFGEGDVTAKQTEPEAIVEDDYSDDEIDVDELERRMWRDKMRLKRLKEQSKPKEGIDAVKQRQSQGQYMLKMMAREPVRHGVRCKYRRLKRSEAMVDLDGCRRLRHRGGRVKQHHQLVLGGADAGGATVAACARRDSAVLDSTRLTAAVLVASE